MSRNVTVILMPGLDGTGELFHDFLRACPPVFSPRVITYPRDELQTFDHVVSQIADTLDRNYKSLLIAESFSGPYAISLAHAASDRLMGVILCNSFVTSPIPAIVRLVPLSVVFRVPPPEWAIRRYLVGEDASDDVIARVKSTLRTVPPHIVAGRVKTVLGIDVRRKLRECTVPVRYIRGTEDRLVPERSVGEILNLRPGVAVSRIAGPHFLLQVAPAQAWVAVQEFLRTAI